MKKLIFGLFLILSCSQTIAQDILVNRPATIRVWQSGIQVASSNITSEVVLATISIPANSMGLNGRIRVSTLWTYTNSANTKTPRVRFGGAGGTIFQGISATTSASLTVMTQIANRGATNSQVGNASAFGNSFGASTGAVTTGAIDTTAAVDIVLSCQMAALAETCNLESYLVELIPG